MLKPEDILQNLNPAQIESVVAPPGPLLIFAGPGSGKTRTLTHRIAYLLATEQAQAEQICAITFTNKAASEMRERLGAMVGEQAAKVMQVSTFHALGAKIIRNNPDLAARKPGFSIIDDSDQQRVLKLLVPHKEDVGEAQDFISNCKNVLMSPGDAVGEDRDLADVYRRYEKYLRHNNGVDFDDLIKLPVEMFYDNPEIAEHYGDRYRFIFVDEYQDTNQAQYEFARLLAAKYQNITVVGDDDQSIYGWRGADHRNITKFQNDYGKVATVTLEENYRSRQNLVEVALALIDNNPKRHPKRLFSSAPTVSPSYFRTLPTDYDEAEYVATTIARLRGQGHGDYGDFAVLYRLNAQSRVLELAMSRHRIPYQIANGTAFYERAEIKDMLAYLELLSNPNNSLAFRRAVNVPPRGVGKKTVDTICNLADTKGVSPLEIIGNLPNGLLRGGRAVSGLLAFNDFIAKTKERAGKLSVSQILDLIMSETKYLDMVMAQRQESKNDREQNLYELVSAAKSYGGVGIDAITDFLAEVTLASDQDALDENKGVTLATLHKSKGLEFGTVFVTGLEDGLLPHERCHSLQEERCLLYVGITRAKERLFLTRATRRQSYGVTQNTKPSPFLQEIKGLEVKPNNLEYGLAR